MLTQVLEKKIIDAIVAKYAALSVALPKHQVFGAWQPSLTSVIKNAEDVDNVATVAVSLGTFAQETYTSPAANATGTVALVVRFDMDPKGTALIRFAEPIDDMFRSWQSETYQQAFTALDINGFSVDDVTVNGGTAPHLDTAAGTVSVTWTFTLSGSYRETTTTNSED